MKKEIDEKRVKNAENRKLIFSRAKVYAKEYDEQEKELVRLKRETKFKGGFYVELEAKLLLQEAWNQLEDTLKALNEKAKELVVPKPEPEPATEILFLCSYEGCGRTFVDAGALKKHSQIHADRHGTERSQTAYITFKNTQGTETTVLLSDLDEEDTMFDHGFGPDIRKFLAPLKNCASKANDARFQTVLVAATMAQDIGFSVEYTNGSGKKVRQRVVEDCVLEYEQEGAIWVERMEKMETKQGSVNV
ncbi:hypothetical protein Droror1_Dr00000091 [Drosera rotundifolia]